MPGSIAARGGAVPGPGVAPGALRRGLIAGSAWGLSMAALLIALDAWNCGVVCLSDAAMTTALSTAAGVLTIGPLAALGRRGG